MSQSDTYCSKCGQVITDETPSADPAQGKLCPKCSASTHTVGLSVKMGVTIGAKGSMGITTYPQKLLEICEGLINDGQYSISVVVAHMACEVATERKLSAAFASRGLQYLEDSVLNFLNGYNLANDWIRKLYTSLTNDHIEQQPFWQNFCDSASRRNKIIHGGKIIGQVESQISYQAAIDFVSHLNE